MAPYPKATGGRAIHREGPRLEYVIICHHPYQEKKCTLHPLRGRPDIKFRTRYETGGFRSGALFLFPGGEVLTEDLAGEILGGARRLVKERDPVEERGRMTGEGGGGRGVGGEEHGGDGGPPAIQVILIDGRWGKVGGLAASLGGLRKISLEGYRTGAVRRRPPPEGGLASVEALFVTSLMFGVPDPSLLEGYHFRDRFLELNGLERCG